MELVSPLFCYRFSLYGGNCRINPSPPPLRDTFPTEKQRTNRSATYAIIDIFYAIRATGGFLSIYLSRVFSVVFRFSTDQIGVDQYSRK